MNTRMLKVFLAIHLAVIHHSGIARTHVIPNALIEIPTYVGPGPMVFTPDGIRETEDSIMIKMDKIKRHQGHGCANCHEKPRLPKRMYAR